MNNKSNIDNCFDLLQFFKRDKKLEVGLSKLLINNINLLSENDHNLFLNTVYNELEKIITARYKNKNTLLFRDVINFITTCSVRDNRFLIDKLSEYFLNDKALIVGNPSLLLLLMRVSKNLNHQSLILKLENFYFSFLICTPGFKSLNEKNLNLLIDNMEFCDILKIGRHLIKMRCPENENIIRSFFNKHNDKLGHLSILI